MELQLLAQQGVPVESSWDDSRGQLADRIGPLSVAGWAPWSEHGTTERVLTLLGLLQQRPVWTGPELADRLGVTTAHGTA